MPDYEPGDPVREAERTLLTAFLAIRALHLAVGAAIVAYFWGSPNGFRNRGAALAGLLVMVAASLFIAWRTLPRRSLADPVSGWTDAAAGVATLLLFGAALTHQDLLGSKDWAVSVSYGVVLGAAVAFRRTGFAILITLALALTAAVVRMPSSGAASAALYYAGFFVVAWYVQRKLRGWGRERARDQELRRAAERTLAVEQERNRQHRLIHDTVLQVVEAIGSGLLPAEDARQQARAESVRLRRALETGGDPVAGDLWAVMSDLAQEFSGAGVRVELTSDGSEGTPSEDRLAALALASREALTNARRHAGVASVVLNVSERDSGYQVVVRDRGAGFDPAEVEPGYGLANSIMRRMEDVGGRAEVWSEPGRGTRITLWVPG